MKFSIGYNNKLEMLSLLEKYGDHIESLYFPVPAMFMTSGREVEQEARYIVQVEAMIEKLNELEITPIMLLNSTVIDYNKVPDVISYIKELHENGLSQVTVANPYLMLTIKKNIPGIQMEASTLCFIRNVQEADCYKELGADILTLDRDINRNIGLIRQIKERTRLKTKIILNEGCIKHCVYRYAHYSYLNLPLYKPDDMKIRRLLDRMCISTISQHPEKALQAPFIRPEEMKFYEGIADYFKLSTRNWETEKIEECLKAYIAGKFDGNLIQILNSTYLECFFKKIDNRVLTQNKFSEKLWSCDENCQECNYCKELLKKASTFNTGEKCRSCSLYKEYVEKKIARHTNVNDGQFTWNTPFLLNPRQLDWGGMQPDMTLKNFCTVIVQTINSDKKDKFDVIDIGCGNGRNSKIFDEIKEAVGDIDINYTGIDFAKSAVEFCKNEYKEKNKTFRLQDMTTKLKEIHKEFDLAIDFGCFHAIPPNQRARYVMNLNSILKERGFFILATWLKKGSSYTKTEQSYYMPYGKLQEWNFNEVEIEDLFSKYFFIEDTHYDITKKNDGFLFTILRKNLPL